MATLIEVLKDEVSRKQLVRTGSTLLILFILMFIIGFISAFVYNHLFPNEGGEIQKQIDRILDPGYVEQSNLPEPPRPTI